MSHFVPIEAVEPPGAEVGQVYVLHFTPPYRHARHYIGWAVNAEKRIGEHVNGHLRAGRLPAHAFRAGCALNVAAIVPGSRWYERWLKNRGSAARVCPICTGRPLPTPTNQEAGSWAT